MSENAVLEIGRARLQPQRIELGRGDQNEVDGRRERCEAPGSALVSAHVPCGSRRSRGACRSPTRHATRGVTVCDAWVVGRRGAERKSGAERRAEDDRAGHTGRIRRWRRPPHDDVGCPHAGRVVNRDSSTSPQVQPLRPPSKNLCDSIPVHFCTEDNRLCTWGPLTDSSQTPRIPICILRSSRPGACFR